MKRIILILGLLIILVGCVETPLQTNLNTCKNNIDEFDCDMLLFCDSQCDELSFNTPTIACHSRFTNKIIAKCT